MHNLASCAISIRTNAGDNFPRLFIYTKRSVAENGYFLLSEHCELPSELSVAVAFNVPENIMYNFSHGGERHSTPHGLFWNTVLPSVISELGRLSIHTSTY